MAEATTHKDIRVIRKIILYLWAVWGRLASECSDDLLSVEAPILNEDFAGMVSADDYTCQKHSRNVAFMRLWVHRWLIRYRIQGNAERAQEIEVRVVARQHKNLHRRQLTFP